MNVAAVQALTPTQIRVLELVAGGMTQRQAAGAMGVTISTTKAHLEQVRLRLDACTTTHAVAIALRFGLIE